MSHAATNWLVNLTGLKGNMFRVLFHLCDCHNPVKGCFPSQKYLADKCETSRSVVQANLDKLVEAGFIRKVNEVDPATKRQKATKYILAFEPEFADGNGGETGSKTPETRDRNPVTEPVTGKQQKPGPDFGKSRDRNPVSNPVIEPVKEPSAPTGGGAPDGPPPAGTGGASGEAGAGADGEGPGAPSAKADKQKPSAYADGSQGSGTGEGAKAAIPKPLRHRTRDLIIRWLVRGDIDRFKAMALKFGVTDGGEPSGGIDALADYAVPKHDFHGPQAEQFIAALPLTARRGVAGQVDWVLNWIAGADDNKPFEALAPLENSFRDNPLEGEDAKETRRNDRLAFLRESVERDMAASDADTDDQTTEDAA